MLYSLKHRFIFVHLPRSAGCSICYALRPHLDYNWGWDLGVLRHIPISTYQEILYPLDVRSFLVFYVYRPLEEIRGSFARLIERDRQRIEEIPVSLWRSLLQLPVSATELVEIIWKRNGWSLEDEEEWLRYWLGSCKDSAVRLNFHRLSEDWDWFCRSYFPDFQSAKLDRVNASDDYFTMFLAKNPAG